MINSAKTHFQSMLKQINQAVEFGENLLQRSSSSNIMQWKPKLEECCHYLEDTPILEFPVSSFVKYFPNFEPEKLNVGFVATSEPIIKGLNQVFQGGIESELKVYPRIQEKRVYGVKSKLRVEVLVQPADKVGSLKTYGKEDGSLQVKFAPNVPGTFNIIVSINGKMLTTSSYTVQVKQRLIQVVRELELQGESLQAPTGIAVNSKGQIAVADKKKHCILIIDGEGNCVRKLGCHGNNIGQLNYPLNVTYLNDDNILVADQANLIASSNLTFKQGTLLKASERKAQETVSFGILLAFVGMIKGVLLSLITTIAESRFYHRMVNFYLNLETMDREDLAVLAHVSIRGICLSFPNGELIA